MATGFPAGQTPLETRLQEVRIAVSDGATEIDIVINRMLAITGQWEGMLQPHCRYCGCMEGSVCLILMSEPVVRVSYVMKCQLQNKPSANPVIRPFPVTSVCVMRAAEKVRPPSLSVVPPHTHTWACTEHVK